jgi:hypothetical protein
MKFLKMTFGAALLCLLAGANRVSAQINTPSVSGSAPGASAAPGNTPAIRGRGGPLSDADKAEIAKVADYPAWTPGAGDGDYFIGPAYAPAPELTAQAGVPKGRVESFILNAADSKFYPNTGLRGTTPTRKVTVYIPSQYVSGTPAARMVSADAFGARNNQIPNILDNMIADHRLPVIIAVMVANGGGDGPPSERGLEYDTVSGKFAVFIESEVLPQVEKNYGVTLTRDPDGRMTMAASSGGVASFTMAWFHPELYHRVLTYSGTYVNQHPDADHPHGAWEYHEHLIAESPAKPLRVWLEVGQNDLGSANESAAFHNWLIANMRMAAALKAKGCHCQLIYAKGAKHTDHNVIAQTLPEALEYVWKDYKAATK